MTATSCNNLLLTGTPRCGKTTVLQRVPELVPDLRLAGFYTQEIRCQDRRVGFEAVGLDGGQALLAHVDWKSSIRVGRNGVKPDVLDSLILDELEHDEDEVNAILIDEIGKMECYNARFVEAVRNVLDSPTPVVATVALKGGGFILDVKQRKDIILVKVSVANRDDFPHQIASWLSDLHERRGGARK